MQNNKRPAPSPEGTEGPARPLQPVPQVEQLVPSTSAQPAQPSTSAQPAPPAQSSGSPLLQGLVPARPTTSARTLQWVQQAAGSVQSMANRINNLQDMYQAQMEQIAWPHRPPPAQPGRASLDNMYLSSLAVYLLRVKFDNNGVNGYNLDELPVPIDPFERHTTGFALASFWYLNSIGAPSLEVNNSRTPRLESLLNPTTNIYQTYFYDSTCTNFDTDYLGSILNLPGHPAYWIEEEERLRVRYFGAGIYDRFTRAMNEMVIVSPWCVFLPRTHVIVHRFYINRGSTLQKTICQISRLVRPPSSEGPLAPENLSLELTMITYNRIGSNSNRANVPKK